jgi:hypothetical protein
MPHSKKGRLAGGARKEINESRAAEAVSIAFMSVAERTRKAKVLDFVFGRVTKMTGANHVRVAIVAKHGTREIPARIPNIFARRGATPITTRSIVTIYTGADFDPDEKDLVGAEHFDITSILTDRQIADLKKIGAIPDWMTNSDATAAVAGKGDEDGFVWAYDDGGEAKGDSDDDSRDAAAGAGFSRKAARDAVDDEDLDVDAI